MPPIHEHEKRHVPANNNNSPPEPRWRLLYELGTIPLCFALMIVLWSVAIGEVQWWMWAGLAWFGGLGVWAAVLSITGHRSHA